MSFRRNFFVSFWRFGDPGKQLMSIKLWWRRWSWSLLKPFTLLFSIYVCLLWVTWQLLFCCMMKSKEILDSGQIFGETLAKAAYFGEKRNILVNGSHGGLWWRFQSLVIIVASEDVGDTGCTTPRQSDTWPFTKFQRSPNARHTKRSGNSKVMWATSGLDDWAFLVLGHEIIQALDMGRVRSKLIGARTYLWLIESNKLYMWLGFE